MRIIIDGHGRIDRQAMAVERLKTIDMTVCVQLVVAGLVTMIFRV